MEERNRDVRKFIETDVKTNSGDAKDKRAIVTGVIDQVQKAIPSAGNIQYLGSNYEGNATKNSSDYDATFNVAPKGSKFQPEHIPGQPGYDKLKYVGGADPQYVDRFVGEDGYLSGREIIQKEVQSSVDKLIGVQDHGGHLNVGGTRVDTKRSIHGPAVTLDMTWGDNQHAQVDIVPSVDRGHLVGGKDVDYVPKPDKSSEPSMHDDRWRQSSNKEQKSAFSEIDKGNQVHREVLKTAKTVRANDESLSGMPSYVLKTAALTLAHKDDQRVSEGAAPKKWDSAHTADRLQDLGKEVYKGLDRGVMSDPNNAAENVLSRTTPQEREQWKHSFGADGSKLFNKVTGND